MYEPDIGIIADANETLECLLNSSIRLRSETWAAWAKEKRNVYEQLTRLEEAPNHDSVDMKEIIRILQKQLPPDSVITNDAGNFSGWLHSFYQFNHKKTYVGPTSGAMGYGVPAAIGVKMAKPDHTVVSLSGDGGFMMTMQELETAVRYNTPIISLVFNNNMYGTIRMHQEKHFPYRVIGTSLGNPDFTLMGQSMGVFSQKVTADDQFEEALQKAMDSAASFFD